jgi:ubiquinone biosynthesis protein UbiJ
VQPPKKKRKRSTKKKAEAKTDEETEGSVRKEVKDFFEKVKERRKQEELEAKKMKVVRRDSRLSYTIRKQKVEGNHR